MDEKQDSLNNYELMQILQRILYGFLNKGLVT